MVQENFPASRPHMQKAIAISNGSAIISQAAVLACHLKPLNIFKIRKLFKIVL